MLQPVTKLQKSCVIAQMSGGGRNPLKLFCIQHISWYILKVVLIEIRISALFETTYAFAAGETRHFSVRGQSPCSYKPLFCFRFALRHCATAFLFGLQLGLVPDLINHRGYPGAWRAA